MSGDPRILTFGCRLNAFESEVMRGHARAAGLGEDTVIVNSCAVTAEAERQVGQAIRRARRENPEAHIIVTGCAAQIDPQRYAAMPEVDRVIGNEEKLRAESFLPGKACRVAVADIMAVRATAPHPVSGFEGRARGFVQIQQGCDHRCTFCTIPYGRGNSRSAPLSAVVEQAQSLVAAGHREIVLTGVDISGYGGDLPGQPGLGRMTRRLLAQIPALERLRLSSMDCVEAAGDDALMRLIEGEPRLMPHLHLSLQSGDDMVLRRMKRRHGRAQAIAFAERVRALRPGIALGADLIAGFPTETQEMFENTLSLVEACGLAWLHVFPYSPRRGTPAAKMPQVPAAVRKERAARLRQAGEAAAGRFMDSRIGGSARVLVERDNTGYCEHFAPVRLTRPAPEGALVDATITARDGATLLADPVRRAA